MAHTHAWACLMGGRAWSWIGNGNQLEREAELDVQKSENDSRRMLAIEKHLVLRGGGGDVIVIS